MEPCQEFPGGFKISQTHSAVFGKLVEFPSVFNFQQLGGFSLVGKLKVVENLPHVILESFNESGQEQVAGFSSFILNYLF